MRAEHTCPADPFRDMFHQTVTEDGETYDAGCWLECVPNVEFHWDQWMVCLIRCLHGCVKGTACGINFTESFTLAVEQFNALDHSAAPRRSKRDGESWGDFWERAYSGPYDSPEPAVPPTAQVAGEPEPPPATTTLSDRLEKGPW